MKLTSTLALVSLGAKRCQFTSPDAPIIPKFYRYVTEVARNCVYHLFNNIQKPTILNMSRKIHTRKRNIINKLTIKKNNKN